MAAQQLQRSETEPCLYVYYQREVLALLMLYVDDVILATNSETYKSSLFAAINDKYDLKMEENYTTFWSPRSCKLEQKRTSTSRSTARKCSKDLTIARRTVARLLWMNMITIPTNKNSPAFSM